MAWDSEAIYNLGNFLYAVAGLSLIGILGIEGCCEKVAPKPIPPIYRDVNGDGIEDKIIQRRGFCSHRLLEDKVLYGIDINGKRIYLPQ